MTFLRDGTLDHLRRVTGEPDLCGTRYRIEGEIGRGGMGIVYEAWDSKLERRVALKVVESESPAEARTLARLEHPGLVPVYDAGSLPDGRQYYAMRLLRGQRLDEFLRGSTPLSGRLRIFVRICEAVAFAHGCGVIHRDLKPRNIMVGSLGEVFVLDWGLAHLLGEGPPQPAGTPPYLAPEPPDRIDHRADIYSLGRVLSDLLAGSGPRPLQAIARRAASPHPGDRYPDAGELAADVTRYLDGLPVAAYRENMAERAGRFARNNSVLLLLLLAFFLVKVALFFISRH